MATYNITAPDGTKYQVTAPDGVTQDQVMAYVQQQHGAQSSDGVNRQALSDQYYRAKLDGRDDDANAMLQSLRSRGWAPLAPNAQQQEALFQQVNAQNVASQPAALTALQGVGQAFVNTGRGIGQMVGAISPQDVQEDRRIDTALSNTNAGTLGNLAGQGVQTLAAGGALGAGAKLAGLAGRAVPYITSGLAGGAFAGSQPVAPGESRAANTALGTAAGVVGEAIPQGLSALSGKAAPAVSLAKQDAIATAQKYGIPLHLSQVTDSKPVQTVASVTKYLPFSGNAAAQSAQQQAFNRALSNQIGENAPSLTDEVLGNAAQRIDQGYDNLFARNSVKIDPQAITQLGALWQEAGKNLPADYAQVVQNQITKYFNAAQANGGTIPGRLYQNVRATLQSAQNGNSPAAHLIGQVRNVMEDAANRSMGSQDAGALASLNDQYKTLKTLTQAVNKRADGAGGDVAPARLWSLVNGKYGSTPAMRELGRLGQVVLKDPIPDSGTAQRLLYEGGLLGGSALAPHTVLPGMVLGASAGRVLNSPLAARVLPYAGQNLLLGLSKGAAPAPYVLPGLIVNRVGQQPIVAPQQ